MKKVSISILSLLILLCLGLTQNVKAQTAYAYCYDDKGGLIGGQGPITFDVTDPMTITLLQNQNGQNGLMGSTWIDGVWYGITAYSHNVVTIDPTTGTRTVVLPAISMLDLTGIAYDPITSVTYVIQFDGQLYSLDMATGSISAVGTPNINMSPYLFTFASDGTLYVGGGNGSLYTMDPSTGTSTLVAPLDVTTWAYQGFSFTPDGTLYWTHETAWGSTGISDFRTLDPATGVSTLIGSFPGNAQISGIVFEPVAPCVGKPILTAPENNSFCASVTPTMNWDAVTSATGYTVQFSMTSDFSDIALTADVTTNTYTVPTANALTALTKYYWRVQAHIGTDCSGSWSSKFNFTTDGTLPVVTLLSPENGSTGVSNPVAFIWDPVGGANQYNIQASTTSDFSTTIVDQTIGSSNYGAMMPLNTLIYWRVRPINPCSTGAWSETHSFTTNDVLPTYAYNAYDSQGLINYAGPCFYFNSDPGTVTMIANQNTLNYILGGAWVDGVWYATEDGSWNLLTIDQATGARNIVGYTGVTNQPIGLAYDYSSSVMYLMTYGGTIYTVDLATGAATLVGSTVYTDYGHLAFGCSPDGTLYGASGSIQSLVTWDKTTGVPTTIAPLTDGSGGALYFWYLQCWGFDIPTNTLYWACYNEDTGTSSLRTVNTATGVTTNLAQFYSNCEMTGMAISFVPPCLTQTTLETPANDAYCISVTPTLTWDAVTGATTYDLQVSTVPDFSDLTLSVDGIAAATYTVPTLNALNPLTRYFWRVMAFNGPDCASWWSGKFHFTTDGPLTAVTLNSPADGLTGVSPSVMFHWDAVPGATEYHLLVSTLTDFSTLTLDQTVTTNQYRGSLPTLTQLYWKVKAINPCTEGAWSPVWNFTTSDALIAMAYCYTDFGGLIGGQGPITFDVSDPATVTLLNIQNGLPQVIGSAWIDGVWYGLTEGSHDFVSLDPVTGERTVLYPSLSGLDLTSMTYDPTTNTLFVINFQGQLYSVDIATGLLTQVGLASGTYEYIYDLGCTSDGVLYAGGGTGATSYLFTIDKTTSIGTIVANTDVTLGGYQGWCFAPDGTLYWSHLTAWGGTNDFRTVNLDNATTTLIGAPPGNAQISGLLFQPVPPCVGKATLLTPATGSYCISITPTLDWDAVPTATGYTVQISMLSDFSELTLTADVTTDLYTVPTANALTPLTKYYWRVQAHVGTDCSGLWSAKFNFVTDGTLPAVTQTSPDNGATDVNDPTKFAWDLVVGASQYNIQVSLSTDFSTPLVDQVVTTNAYGTMLPLTTVIYWRVRAENPCGNGAWSTVRNFTTAANYPSFGYITTDWLGLIGVGPCYFYTSDPATVTLITNQSTLPALTAGAWINGLWYAIEGYASGTMRLMTVDPGTGARTVVGSTGMADPVGLAYDMTTNTAYGLDYQGTFYSIDLATGIATMIGFDPYIYGFYALTCSNDGTVYGINASTRDLYTFDKATGTPTVVAPITDAGGATLYWWGYEDMDFDVITNTLYWSCPNDYYYPYQGQLRTIDPITGVSTLINNFYSNAEISAMAIPYVPPCLDQPTLTTPENNAYCISLTPTLTWGAVLSATTYSLQVATTTDFSTPVLVVDGITTNTYTIPTANSLTALTQYYWRIQAHNGPDCSGWWAAKFKFFTAGTMTAAILTSPENGATDMLTSPVLTWDPVIGATAYHVEIAPVSDFSTLTFDQDGVTGTSITASGLVVSTGYYWRVQAENPCGTAAWSLVFNFHTGNFIGWFGTGTTEGGTTGLPTPYGRFYHESREQYIILASEITAMGGTAGDISSLAFNVGSLNLCDAMLFFTIRLKMTTANGLNGFDYTDLNEVVSIPSFMPILGVNTHTFATPFTWDGVSNILIDVCFHNDPPIPYTQDAGVYYTNYPDWYANYGGYPTVHFWSDATPTTCDPGGPTYSSLYSSRPNMLLGFVGSAVPTPTLLTPVNHYWNVPVNPLLTWTDDPSIVTNYTVLVSTVPDFSTTVVNQSGITAMSYQVPTGILTATTKYYWKVMGFDISGNNSIWSQKWDFITSGPLAAPILVAPDNGVTGTETALNFQWNPVIAAMAYHLEVATDIGFTNIVANVPGLTTTSYSLTGLSINTPYFWRVQASNDWVTSPWSTIWTFTTGAFIPIGDGTGYSNGSEPTPYDQYWTQSREQYLIHASEILDAGGSAGDITSITFNVQNIGAIQALDGFTIKMKMTTVDQLTDFDYDGYTDVFYSTAYMPTNGKNLHQFTTPFTWDGTSNIIVTTCADNGILNYTYSASVYWTYYPTWTPSVYSYSDQVSNPCGTSYIGLGVYTSNYRPNMELGVSGPSCPAPILVSPANGSTGLTISPTLIWNTVDCALQYEVMVSTVSNFATTITDVFTTNAFYPLSDLDRNTVYYWRIKSWNDVNSSPWSSTWNFQTTAVIPPPWTVVTETGNNSTIVVQTNLNPMIGDRAMTTGDAIGLFYQQTPGVWACGGYEIWNGTNLAITVWGDNDQTTVKDGFTVGETYTFKVWDGLLLRELPATATYESGPSNYQVNAFSVLSSLTIYIPTTQTYDLPIGWSMISSYVTPFQAGLNDIFTGVTNNITIMKNGLGQNYIPAQGINTIGNWNVLNGYQIKLNAETAFQMYGVAATPESTPIPLLATWNLISYLRTTPSPIGTALAGLGNTVVIAKNGLGQMYVPAYGINQIGNMHPGEGYYVNVNTAENLIYPVNGALKAIAGEQLSPMAKYLIPVVSRTGNDASFIMDIAAENGNEVGVYNTAGELIGSGVVNNGTAAITIWGDDATTDAIEGAANGENLTAKLYDVTNNTYTNITLSNVREVLTNSKLNQLSYSKDGLFMAHGATVTTGDFELSISNSPNPFGASTEIGYTIPTDGNVELNVYDVQGNLVKTVINGSSTKGEHTVNFESGMLTSGVYNLVLRVGTQQVSTMMMIVK